jgi:hypothetical protein
MEASGSAICRVERSCTSSGRRGAYQLAGELHAVGFGNARERTVCDAKTIFRGRYAASQCLST